MMRVCLRLEVLASSQTRLFSQNILQCLEVVDLVNLMRVSITLGALPATIHILVVKMNVIIIIVSITLGLSQPRFLVIMNVIILYRQGPAG